MADVFDGLPILPKLFDDLRPRPTARANIQKLQELQDKLNTKHTSLVMDYHQSFDSLFRASERIRHQQKYQYVNQIEAIQEAHAQELADIEDCRFKTVMYNKLEFNPNDIDVNDFMKPYLQKALELNKPLIEILPPSLLADRLHYMSGTSSSSDTSSSSAGRRKTNSISSSSGADSDNSRKSISSYPSSSSGMSSSS